MPSRVGHDSRKRSVGRLCYEEKKEIMIENEQLYGINEELKTKNRQLRIDNKELESFVSAFNGYCHRKLLKIEKLNTQIRECKHIFAQVTQKFDCLIVSKRKLSLQILVLQRNIKHQKKNMVNYITQTYE